LTDYSFFDCKYIKRENLREIADKFREKHWKQDIVPVDMEYIIESELGLNIEPLHGMSRLIFDAFLRTDLSGIIVDYDQYMDGDNRYAKRLRFSFAHEIGHYVLHDYIYNNLDITTPDDYFDFIQYLPDHDYRAFEWQANEFAGRLLVPKNALIDVLEGVCAQVKDYDNRYEIAADKELFLEKSSPVLCKPFGISEDVIIRRVKEEDLMGYIK